MQKNSKILISCIKVASDNDNIISASTQINSCQNPGLDYNDNNICNFIKLCFGALNLVYTFSLVNQNQVRGTFQRKY